jgi:hypothetical protein
MVQFPKDAVYAAASYGHMSTLVHFHLPLALSHFHTAFIKGMPFGACLGHMPQPVLTCTSVVVQLVTSVNDEFDRGI